MLSGDKNLKDSTTNTNANINMDISLTDMSFSISYSKTHKLITALYMVTDIIDKEEPIRNKLRSLGTEIISDMHSIPLEADSKISEAVSFLSIASAMNFISEMNYTILKKEFLELKASIQEYTNMKPTWLADFLLHSHPILEELSSKKTSIQNQRKQSIGHIYKGQQISTRIGVQKGSTLMKALSDKTNFLSNSNSSSVMQRESKNNFDILKKQRRDDIIKIIKDNGGNATIKDIRVNINGMQGLSAYSEKTLQRELMSMIKDDILNKTGEKRWSRYFIKI